MGNTTPRRHFGFAARYIADRPSVRIFWRTGEAHL